MLAAAPITIVEAAPTPTAVRKLTTAHYRVTIREFCPKDFDCNQVEYRAVKLGTSRTITLHGSHIWHMCPGTNDPCHPIGYVFKNKGVEYMVTENGELVVTQGSKTLLNEPGKWNDE